MADIMNDTTFKSIGRVTETLEKMIVERADGKDEEKTDEVYTLSCALAELATAKAAMLSIY